MVACNAVRSSRPAVDKLASSLYFCVWQRERPMRVTTIAVHSR